MACSSTPIASSTLLLRTRRARIKHRPSVQKLTVDMLGAASGLPSEALDVLQRLSASNEGRLPDKLALLERRLTVPPSPAASQGAGSLLLNQNSVHSVTQQLSGAAGKRHATPSISNTLVAPPPGPQEGGRSLEDVETSSEHPSKRRRVQQQQQPAAEQALGRTYSNAMGAAARATSPPALQQQGQQQKLSPFLADNSRQGQPAASAQPTPGSSKKQKNTISRYFPNVSGGGGAVAGGAAGDTAARHLAPSPAPSDPQFPAAAAVVQTLQLEAQRLRCGPAVAFWQRCCCIWPATPRCTPCPPLLAPCTHISAPGTTRRNLRLASPSFSGHREDNVRLQGELDRATAEQACLSDNMQRLEAEAAVARQASSSRDETVRCALRRLCTEAARQERELTLQRLQAAAPRLGCLGVRRHGINVQEVSWACSVLPASSGSLVARGSDRAARCAAKLVLRWLRGCQRATTPDGCSRTASLQPLRRSLSAALARALFRLLELCPHIPPPLVGVGGWAGLQGRARTAAHPCGAA